MKSTCYKWIFTALGDDLGLMQQLNRLVEQGWELIPSGDGTCYAAKFRRTDRTELRYAVETAPLLRSENDLKRKVEQRALDGWEAVGTINGLDVYQSMPCRVPEPEEQRGKTRCWTRSALSVFLATLAIGLCRCWPLLGKEWYLTDLGVFLRLSGTIVTPVAVLWVLWRVFRLILPAKKAAPSKVVLLRGLIAALFRLWLMLLMVCVVLTLVPALWAAGILILGVLLRILAGLEREPVEGKLRWNKAFSAWWRLSCVGLVLLTAMGLNRLGITPTLEQYSVGSAPWRHDLPVVHADELTENPGELLYAEFEKKGSLLIQRSTYSETTETMRLECEIYTCMPGWTEYVERMLEERRPQESRHYAVTVSGNRVMALWSSEEWSADLQTLMEDKLNNKG